MIKLVVSDMDGTLINKKLGISQRNLEAIYQLQEKGITFAIASGRDYHGVYSIMDHYDLHCEAILGNGAQYVDKDGNLLMSCYMNKEVVEAVTQIFVEEKIPLMIFTTKGLYTPYDPRFVVDAFIERSIRRFGAKKEDFEEDKSQEHSIYNQIIHFDDYQTFLQMDLEIIKVEAFSITPQQSQRCQLLLEKIPTISYLSSFDDNYEVCDENAQKGLILEKVIAQKGLKKEEVAVLGDGMNDLSLFQRFPYSFAPANSEKTIQELAYKVVRDCEEDGFQEAIDIIIGI